MRTMVIACFLASMVTACGAAKSSHLDAFGTNLELGTQPLQVMRAYKNDNGLERQLRLLSLASGLNQTLGLRLYSAVNLQNELVEFLAPEGLIPGDIVREGSVFLLSDTAYSGKDLPYKTLNGEEGQYYGTDFAQEAKDGNLIAISGHLGVLVGEDGEPMESPPSSEPRTLVMLCKDQLFKHPYKEEWRQMNCDLNIVDGHLQITYGKSPSKPYGQVFTFHTPVKL